VLDGPTPPVLSVLFFSDIDIDDLTRRERGSIVVLGANAGA
jgi:hypothetical protein